MPFLLGEPNTYYGSVRKLRERERERERERRETRTTKEVWIDGTEGLKRLKRIGLIHMNKDFVWKIKN
jgi:hypothetical protein